MTTKDPRIIHPFVIAVFPVVFLYSHNISEVIASQTILPLGASLVVAFLGWFLLGLIFNNKHLKGLLLSTFLLYFSTYGHFYIKFMDAYIGQWKVGIHTWLLPFWSLLFLLPVFIIFKLNKFAFKLTTLANVMSVIMVFSPVVNIAANLVKTAGSLSNDIKPEITQEIDVVVDKPAYLPDIYYIILDEHARTDFLKDFLDFDNSWFIDGLEERGFTVATKSQSNYHRSRFSLSSSLNYDYLDTLSGKVSVQSINDLPFRDYIKNSKVFRFLKRYGYRTVSFSSGYDYTELADADVYLSHGWAPDNFTNELLNSTMFVAVDKLMPKKSRGLQCYRSRLFTFNKLGELDNILSPKIVFAHILCPHAPYIFNEDGEYTNPDLRHLNFSFEYDFELRKKLYIEQLKYVDKRMLKVVDSIVARSLEPPVIIVQGDHGLRWGITYSERNDDDMPMPDKKRWRFDILNAYYLPGVDKTLLYDSISPVNTFRVIFNHYFDAGLELLDDKQYIHTYAEKDDYFEEAQ